MARALVTMLTFRNRVLEVMAGASAQTMLPFKDLNAPRGAAVDDSGNIYVTDNLNNRVLRAAAG